MNKALALVKSLPDSLSSGACSASSRGLLEALRQSGEAAFDHLGRFIREESNQMVKRAAKAGERREYLLTFAVQRYQHAAAVPSQSGVAYCNAAAVELMLKDYKAAAQTGRDAAHVNTHREVEPATYHAKRAACLASLRLGRFCAVPPALAPHRTEAQQKADKLTAWKSQLRLATAHAGLCRRLMNKSGKPSPRVLEEARDEYSDAVRGECKKARSKFTLCKLTPRRNAF